MRFNPYIRITQSRTSDGMGGWTESGTTQNTIYLHVVIHESEVSAIAKADSTVATEDTLLIDSERYKVKGIDAADGAAYKTLLLEKENKPSQG